MIEQMAQRLSRRTSRRGMLARIGRVTLGTAGIVTVGISAAELPVRETGAMHQCSQSQWCGLCGVPCSGCGSGSTCPSGSYLGSYGWSRCCCAPDGFCSMWQYKDCCTTSGGWYCHTSCNLNCPQPAWCPSGAGFYYCTVALYQGAC